MDNKETIINFVDGELRKLLGSEPNEKIVNDVSKIIYSTWVENVYIEGNTLVMEGLDYNKFTQYVNFGKKILGNRFVLLKIITVDEDGSSDFVYYYDIETGEWDVVFDE